VDTDDAEIKRRIWKAILDHLSDCPFAADTPSGILASWLPERGFEQASQHIAAVLKMMVEQNLLCTRSLPDGKSLYLRGEPQATRACRLPN